MIGAWALYTVLVGVLLAGAAQGADRFCRVLRLPVRGVWIAGLAGMLVLSGISLVRLLSPPAGPAAQDANAVMEDRTTGASAVVPEVGRTRALLGGAYRLAGSPGLSRGMAVAWPAGSALLLVVFALTLRRVGRARRAWRAARVDGVDVLVSTDDGPAVIGLRRPAIVIPEWLLAGPIESRRMVVQHEEEHRRSGDHVVLAAAGLIACAMPWNPAVWWLLRGLRLAVELDCDARVLRRGAATASYGSVLLEVAGHARTRAFAAPALTDSPSHLERRLVAMIERHRAPRRLHAAVAGFPALLLGVTACAADLPTAADVENMDVDAFRAEVESAGLIQDEQPLYTVDGAVVEEAVVRELAAREIATIEILKGAAAARAGEDGRRPLIQIRTVTAEASDQAVERVPAAAIERSSVLERRREVERRVQLRIEEVPVSGADRPRLLIDGVPATGSSVLRELSPDEIERVEVVKGEAARRLMGDERGANGVILVTTKSGRGGVK